MKSYPSEIDIRQDALSDEQTEPESTIKNPWDADQYTYAAPPVTFAPNRRLESGATIQGGVKMTGRELAARDPEGGGVHPYVYTYTSPIG